MDHFTYLGSTLSSCCSLDTEIHTQINKASSSFGRLRSRVFENRNLKVSTKVAVYNAVCLSTLLYGAEAWTPYGQHIINLEAFHICCLQKILNLSWEDRIPHTVILSNTDSICMEAAVAKKHLRWLGHTIRMPEHRLPRQVLYSQLMGAKRSAGGQKRRFKDYIRDLLKRANIPLTQLESLAFDRSAWQVTCATAVSQIHQINQDRWSERHIKRHQWAAGTPLVSGFPCSICGRVCGSRIRLDAHEKWHQRQRRWTHPPPTPIPGASVIIEYDGQLRVCVRERLSMLMYISASFLSSKARIKLTILQYDSHNMVYKAFPLENY